MRRLLEPKFAGRNASFSRFAVFIIFWEEGGTHLSQGVQECPATTHTVVETATFVTSHKDVTVLWHRGHIVMWGGSNNLWGAYCGKTVMESGLAKYSTAQQRPDEHAHFWSAKGAIILQPSSKGWESRIQRTRGL